MTGPDPAVAAVRRAVRRTVAEVREQGLLLVACSGGVDSLALLAGLAWEAPRQRRNWGVVHVDHGLQAGSATQALRVAEQAKSFGCDAVETVTPPPVVARPGEGPEAAARRVRYAALDDAAERTGAAVVMLGHTLDDQAETVLLGLARGSGGRSLAGMPHRRGVYRRPLLGLTRQTTEQACAAEGLEPWLDPSNADVALLRNRVRHRVLPLLEAELGPGVAEALARTAALLAADADFLDELVRSVWSECVLDPEAGERVALSVAALSALPDALRTRVIHQAAVYAGSPGGLVAAVHVWAIDELVGRWHGQGPVDLPGGLVGARRYDRLVIAEPDR